MKTETTGSPTPPEALIPEARQHQRHRYQRRGGWVVIAGLVIAALIVSALLLFHGPAAGGRTGNDPKPVAAAATSAGAVYFRPVLCFAAPYAAPAGTTTRVAPTGNGPIPACSATALLSASNLDVTPTPVDQGFSSRSSQPDPQYASYPSTSPQRPDYASSTVLLPGIKGACDAATLRCVLGPAELSSRVVAKANAHRDRTGSWVVDYTMTESNGAALWDRVAQENFHQLIGIETGGVVYSTPIIQPTQSSFSSFNGKGEISGSLTRAEAVHLAKALDSRKG